MLTHDTATSIGEIYEEIKSNIYDEGVKWFTREDILAALQEAYNKLVAILAPLEYSTFIPMRNDAYYNLARQIPDFMYLAGIFNPQNNLWLEGISYKIMKATYQTYLAIGSPKFFSVVDLRKVIIWPFPATASGVLYVLYKASAPQISMSHIPILPHSVASPLLENFATADLLEQAREFKKASIYWDRIYKAPEDKRSLLDQAMLEVKDIARADRETVLEPYRWIFHGGQFNVATWVSNETPVGAIDGLNVTFTLAQVPNPTASLLVVRNGMTQINGISYTLSGQTITFQTNYIPQVDDVVRAWYQVS